MFGVFCVVVGLVFWEFVLVFFQFLNAWLYPVHSESKCLNPTVVFRFGLPSFISDWRELQKVGDVVPPQAHFGRCWHNFQDSWGLQFPCRRGRAFPLFLPHWVESLAGSPCFLIMHFLCFFAVLPIWRVLFFHYLTEYPEWQSLPLKVYLLNSCYTNDMNWKYLKGGQTDLNWVDTE